MLNVIQLEEVNTLLENVFSRTVRLGGYVKDVSLVLRSNQAGASNPFLGLPCLCCETVGGRPRQAIPVMAAWYALMFAARIFDDLEDGETDGYLWKKLGVSRTINVATGLILAAPLALLQLQDQGIETNLLLELIQATQSAALRIGAGQREDLAQVEDVERGWKVVEAKGGEPFALACRTGAMVGGGTAAQATQLGEFGLYLGVLTQIADDVSGIWHALDRSDLVAGRKTLPVAYGLALTPPAQRECLRSLFRRAQREAAAAIEVRKRLADLGVLHVMVIETGLWRQRARNAMEDLGAASPAKEQLLELVEQATHWMNKAK
jgi:competence protein ComQ